MTIDEPRIKHFIREFLGKNPHSGATVLHTWVMRQGNGSFGETAIWKTIKSMANSDELDEDRQENKRTFYSLGDITRDISKKLDSLAKDLESIRENLTEFHTKYHSQKSQTEQNYLTRLMELTTTARTLLKSQSYLFLVAGFPDFKTHKSWKNINKTVDELWQSIRANAGHQIGNNNKFFQELIWSLQGFVRDEHSTKAYSGLK